MRTVTATEKYRAVTEGRMAQSEFVRQMRQQFPSYISNFNGFPDTVQILKNKGMIFELAQDQKAPISDFPNVPIEAMERGVQMEADKAGLCLHDIEKTALAKIKEKVIDNLKKDPLYYINIIAGESSKVDKHDKMVPAKEAKTVDTFNGMKKAELKESFAEKSQGRKITDEQLSTLANAAGKIVKAAKDALEELANYYDENDIPLEHVKEVLSRYDMTLADLKKQPAKAPQGKPSFAEMPGYSVNEQDIKEGIKKAIKKIIVESLLQEAATVNLSEFKNKHSKVEGIESIITPLENIVTEVESFYEKINRKIQDAFDKIGELRDKDGIPIGGNIAEAVQMSLMQDLKPVLQKFPTNIVLPKKVEATLPEMGMDELEEPAKQTMWTAPDEPK